MLHEALFATAVNCGAGALKIMRRCGHWVQRYLVYIIDAYEAWQY